MDPTVIKPFIASIQNVFSTMMQLQVSIGEPRIKSSNTGEHDVSGIIGLSGDVVGSVVLSFPTETATNVVALFCGMKVDPTSPDFADAIGELGNMVSGGAKAMFHGRKASISCPSVVLGKNHVIARPSGVPCIVIPCMTDCGDFVIEVAIKNNDSTVAESKTATAKA
ncbi:MAG: chemotaxis protein CheX [Phycisphaerales bacterium]|nr:MAG: chemotaxis protein CheX [Phycisphaerales bacterium]